MTTKTTSKGGFVFNPRQALGLPTGSVRAILALLVVAPIGYLAITSGIKLSGDQFVGLVSLVLTAYFVSKSAARG